MTTTDNVIWLKVSKMTTAEYPNILISQIAPSPMFVKLKLNKIVRVYVE